LLTSEISESTFELAAAACTCCQMFSLRSFSVRTVVRLILNCESRSLTMFWRESSAPAS